MALPVLFAWIGSTDLRAARGEDNNPGPVAHAVAVRPFCHLVLLCNYPTDEGRAYVAWLSARTPVSLELHSVTLTSPVHFGDIYQAVTERVATVLARRGADTPLTFHLSPGTPAMAAVWIIVAKTRYAAELLESSREQGVRTAIVPFDLSAEFLPGLYERLDGRLTRLGGGEVDLAPAFVDIIHDSLAMAGVLVRAQRVAVRSSVPVLIEGESGTGKELLARAIHQASPRRGKPFVAVNCGAIPAELAESEFFGHRKGAFTGATADRLGHFRAAEGGVLFLDEIGDLPLTLQAKLLRALQERQVTPVGDSRAVTVDVRILAATHHHLAQAVAVGHFRADLFYRLAVAVLRLPPLRDRPEDLAVLIDTLWKRIQCELAAEPDWTPKTLAPAARQQLLIHPWPGNIRELQNTLTRALVWSSGPTVSEDDIAEALFPPEPQDNENGPNLLNRPLDSGFNLQALLDEVTRHYLQRALTETGGHKSRASALLGLPSYQTLNNWLKRLEIE
ncbi:AAA family ATPase [Gammaproteobacteria bacterium]